MYSQGRLVSAVAFLTLTLGAEALCPCNGKLNEQATRRAALISILGTTSASYLITTKPSIAVSTSFDSNEIREIYDEGASTYEKLYSDSMVSRTLDFVTLRRNLLSRARGDVLELGVGTGLNLPMYLSEMGTLSSYTGMDISPNMMEQAQNRFKRSSESEAELAVSPALRQLYEEDKVHFKIGDVTNLSSLFSPPGMKFDTIVDTFGLCVFPEPAKALSSAREMLKPGGQLLLLEHQDSLVGKALSPSRKIADVASTCRYDDDVLQLLRDAGFQSISSKSLAGGFLIQVVAKNIDA